MSHFFANVAHRFTGRRRLSKTLTVIMLLAMIGLAATFKYGGTPVSAAACAAPPSDYGTDTMNINVPGAATYVLWTRILVPDSTNNAINVQIDSTSCYNVGGSASIPSNTWTWVNYQNGATSTPISMSLAAGSHTVKLIGTKPGVEVDRVILTSDTSCTPTGTGDTCATGDATPPTVSLTAPTNNSTATGNVTLSATASDASGITSVKFLVDGATVSTDTSSPYSYSWDSSSVSNGAHTITAQATDNAGNTANSTTVNVTVSNTVTCSATPSVPTGLAVSSKTDHSVSLSWSASTPGAGCTIASYKLYRGTTLVATVTSGTSYTDSGLTPSTAYGYSVAASDTSGHTSAKSSTVNVTTSADTSAPTPPMGVTSTLITANNVALSWNASIDDVQVAGYTIYRNGSQVGTSATTAFTDSGLTPGTTYTYTVKAYDASNNYSTASTAINVTTLSAQPANNGDLNSDGKVNITDLSIMLSHWNHTGASLTDGDVNGDGKVSITDLSILLSHWGS